VFGEPLAVSGALAGTGSAGAAVVLQEDTFPYSVVDSFTTVGSPQTTSAAGAFRFALPYLAESAKLRVALAADPNIHSRTIAERVALNVTLHVRPATRPGFLRFYGTVTPSPSRSRVPVLLERLIRGRHGEINVVPVSRAKLTRGPHGASRFSRVVRLQPGAYRAVAQTWGLQVTGISRSVQVR